MRDQIFVSYSHVDKKWLDLLEINLRPLVEGYKLKLWSDKQITPGAGWKTEIDSALASAKVAVLFVSPDFLASDFITKCELPALLEANQKNELRILWVAVSPSLVEYTTLARFQAAHEPSVPLDSLSKSDRGKALVEISKKIKLAYESGNGPRNPIENPLLEAEAAGTEPLPLIVLLYKRKSSDDERVLQYLSDGLTSNGYRVFIDKHMKIGVRWAQEIAEQMRNSYAVVPLLSPSSILSEMFTYEIETASEVQKDGLPHLLPVRLNFESPLPDVLASILDPIQYALWRGPEDDQLLLEQLLTSLTTPPPRRETKLPKPAPPAAPVGPLEPPSGAVPLNSKFYLTRPSDAKFFAALEENDGVVLVKGARQMGKTSLLARGLQKVREVGASVVVTDLQALNASHMETIDALFRSLSRMIAEQLGSKLRPDDVWDSEDPPNTNFRRFLQNILRAENISRLVWSLDEVDRLFTYDYRNDVFGLFRALYNARQLDPDGPWDKLTLAIIYATEAHLFITDPNMSPFNVGTEIEMKDFCVDHVEALNLRFPQPAPLKGEESTAFCQLVGGHPYLVRRGFYEMKKHGMDFQTFKERASTDEGPYGDHLHRIVAMLGRDLEMVAEVRRVIDLNCCSTDNGFYRLRSAGIIAGDSRQAARMRCEVYGNYLSSHLPALQTVNSDTK